MLVGVMTDQSVKVGKIDLTKQANKDLSYTKVPVTHHLYYTNFF